MPSVATWWCGQEGAAALRAGSSGKAGDQADIPPLRPASGVPVAMDAAARAELVRKIEAQPEQFVAPGAGGMLSTAPCVPSMGWRRVTSCCACSRCGTANRYTVMPRRADDGFPRRTRRWFRCSRRGAARIPGSSKVTGGPRHRAPAHSHIHSDPRPARSKLPSRVADNLFWLGRYTERVESGVRLVRVLLPALSGEEDFGGSGVARDRGPACWRHGHYLPPEVFRRLAGARSAGRYSACFGTMVYDPTRDVRAGLEFEARCGEWRGI